MKATTYGALKNGDKVRIAGYLFTVANLRSYPAPDDACGRRTIRFDGIAEQGSDIQHTGYDGGTYGGWSDAPCLMEVSTDGQS